ncbi:MAG: RNA polymerase sigma factor [Acidimicrobiales bacterium]
MDNTSAANSPPHEPRPGSRTGSAGSAEGAQVEQSAVLLELYDDALPQIHGYLMRRCRSRLVAEDLTAEVFMAAVAGIKSAKVETVTVAWLIGIARHKLVDHWRRQEREQRRLESIAGELTDPPDGWESVIDSRLSHEILAGLATQHRAALTLRYLDGLPVAQVATHLERTVQATEALLTRSKAAFRQAYSRQGGSDV